MQNNSFENAITTMSRGFEFFMIDAVSRSLKEICCPGLLILHPWLNASVKLTKMIGIFEQLLVNADEYHAI